VKISGTEGDALDAGADSPLNVTGLSLPADTFHEMGRQVVIQIPIPLDSGWYGKLGEKFLEPKPAAGARSPDYFADQLIPLFWILSCYRAGMNTIGVKAFS
jgi:hypothetical protein